jgi:hypothetical protein
VVSLAADRARLSKSPKSIRVRPIPFQSHDVPEHLRLSTSGSPAPGCIFSEVPQVL